MEKLNPADMPFSTSNVILAFCLRIAGVPPHNPRLPCRNSYTLPILETLGYTGKGLSMEDAAKQAVEDGKKGQVVYQFKRTKGIGKLCKAFAAQEAEVLDPKTNVDAADFMLGLFNRIEAGKLTVQEGIVRMGCVILKLRPGYVNMWKKMVPMIGITEGKARKFETTVTVRNPKGGTRQVPATAFEQPPMKFLSVNASEATRKHLKV